MKKRDYYEVLGGRQGGVRSRHQEVLPPAGPQASPGRQPGRQVCPEEVPGCPGSLRGPEGRGETESLRPVRSCGRPPSRLRTRPAGRAAASLARGFPPGAGGATRVLLGNGRHVRPLRQHLRRGPFPHRIRAAGRTRTDTIEIPFRDAVLGGTATLTLRREKVCDTCKGTGRSGRGPCPTCRGQGRVAESETVRIKIPEGTEDGGTIRVPGKGERERRAAASETSMSRRASSPIPTSSGRVTTSMAPCR